MNFYLSSFFFYRTRLPRVPKPSSYLRMSTWCTRKTTGSCRQVCSLTQFYHVDFSQSSMGVKKCVFNKRTIKVCVSCSWRCRGTSAPTAAHPTVSLYLCSSESNARGESRALERVQCVSALKKPLRGPRQRRGSCWKKQKRRVFLRQGVIYLPSKQIYDFTQKRKQKKIELVARPVLCQQWRPWCRPQRDPSSAPPPQEITSAAFLAAPSQNTFPGENNESNFQAS